MNRIKWMAGMTACTMMLSIVSPAAQDFGGVTNCAVASAETCAAAQEVKQTENHSDSDKQIQEQSLSSAYDTIKISDLLAKGIFVSSNPEVTLITNKTVEGVLISGKSENLGNAKLSITKELDFGNDGARYLVLDAMAQKKKNISLSFYLDDQKESFATVSLPKQKRDGVWKIENNQYVDISALKITGKHKVTVKVVTEETGDLSVLLKDLVFTDSKLPMLSLNIDESKGYIGDMLTDKNYGTACYGDMSILKKNEDNTTSTEKYDLDYIVGHGSNQDWYEDKKPFRIKLSKKADLFGMGKGKQWVLLAQRSDPTLLRTKLTSYLGEKLGIPYTPKCEFIDVSMNGRYLGSYAICPQIKISKNSVDIDDIDEDENAVTATSGSAITGGYLLNIGRDSEDGNTESFNTKKGIGFYVQSPSLAESGNEAQLKYIKEYVQNVEDAIYGKNFKDSKGHSYKEYLDMDSVVDFYLMNEMMNSMDNDSIFASSDARLYKKRDGKLYFGPIANYYNSAAWGATDEGNEAVVGFAMSRCIWISRLLQDEEFKKLVKQRWSVYKKELQDVIKDGGVIDQWANVVKESHRADVAVQSCLPEKGEDLFQNDYYVGEEDEEPEQAAISINNQYDADVHHLKDWITKRMEWIDRNMKYLKGMVNTVTFMLDSKKKLITLLEDDDMVGRMDCLTPTKKGYQFAGWYTKISENGKKREVAFDRSLSIRGDMTVYAKWKKLSSIPKATNIYFIKSEAYYYQNYGVNLFPIMEPFNAQDTNITWKSSNKEIATVDKHGIIVTREPGVTVITATLSNGKKASCKLHVISYNQEMIQDDLHVAKKMTMVQGKYNILPVKTKMVEYGDLIYTTSDSSVVKVKDGLLYAKKSGKATITVYSASLRIIKSCTVTVKKKSAAKKKDTKKEQKTNKK